ncbi:serine/threonine-protein kinase [Spirillospora albida]|uniref:serine/threonine-protein kinase n=1 Tax=Spirillospora albida TaxID=58123 RepID=UPI00069145B4|nr:serine/threonine-protein kinase [Spirillospora albida]
MHAPLRPSDPTELGPYRLTARLGRGGMGTVFLGADAEGREVAIKVINPDLSDDPDFQERFRREVTAARQVRRFCTAAVLDASLDGDPVYVVTEYVNGPSLDEAVRAGGPLRGGDLEALAVNIATALAAVHGAGIVHRDLKPSNVLLSPTGPRVIDFGIARALDAGSDGPTRTGQFVGTPAYIAPEIMHGGDITAAADVFSWGCVVAYAATGRVPFDGATLPEIIHRVTSADPDLTGLDASLRDLVSRALAKEPAARPTVKRLIQTLTGEEEPPVAPALPPAGPPPLLTAPTPPTTVDSPPPQAHATAQDADPPTRPSGAASRRPLPRRGPETLLGIGAVLGLLAVAVVISLINPFDESGKTPGADGARKVSGAFTGDPPDERERLFADRFHKQDSGWRHDATATWDAAYQDGKYAMQVDPPMPSTVVDAPAPNIPSRQLIEVDLVPASHGGESGVFCHRHEDTGFAFLVRADGSARIALMDGPMTLKTLATGTVEPDDKLRLQAACAVDGASVRLGMWVDGDPVVRVTADDAGDSGDNGRTGLLIAKPNAATGWPMGLFDDFELASFGPGAGATSPDVDGASPRPSAG